MRAGENHAARRVGQRAFSGGVPWQDLRIDTGLAHPARDQLGELRTVVEDDDRVWHRAIIGARSLADLGDPAVAFTYTLNDGSYSFTSVTPGNYVIRETDIFGYASTGDSRPPNDNQIGLRVTPGATTNGNNFFDFCR